MTEDEIFEDTYNFDEPEEPEVIEEPKVVDVKQVDETRNPLPDNHENIPSLAGDKPCTIEFAINLVIIHNFLFQYKFLFKKSIFSFVHCSLKKTCQSTLQNFK